MFQIQKQKVSQVTVLNTSVVLQENKKLNLTGFLTIQQKRKDWAWKKKGKIGRKIKRKNEEMKKQIEHPR